jgi:subtilisin family serine protease
MNRKGLGAAGLVALVFCGGAASRVLADEPPPPHPRWETLDQALAAGVVDVSVVKQLKKTGKVEAIVTFLSEAVSPPLTEEEFEALREADRRTMEDVLRGFNAEQVNLLRRYDALPLAKVRLYSLDTLLNLLRHALVLGVSEDGIEYRSSTANLPLVGKAGPGAWPSAGSGVTVAIIDSGIDYAVPSLGGCVLPGPGCPVAVAGDFAPSDGMRDDALLHGTKVASVVRSIAPAARLMALDVFDGNGARDSDILAAIDFTLLNRAAYNVRAFNLSLGRIWPQFVNECTGGPFARDPYHVAYGRARTLDVLPVAAAGNDGTVSGQFNNGVDYPGCAPGALRVGAVFDAASDFDLTPPPLVCMDTTVVPFQVACFSGTGPLLSLWAPGVNIPVFAGPGTGTSFATPHVTGAVAVLAALKPNATAADIHSALVAPGGRQVTDARAGITRPVLDIPNAARRLQPIANDAFAQARVLQGTTGSWTQSTIGATIQFSEPATAAPDSLRATTWFRWPAVLSGSVSFSTAGSEFDARVRVFTGTDVTLLTPVATTRSILGDGTEIAFFTASAGTTYQVMVGGQPFPQLDSGRLNLQWQMTGAVGDRDMFSQAAVISGPMGSLPGSNLTATKEPGEPEHCLNDGGASVWFAWTAPTTGRYSFRMNAGTLALGCVSVYQGASVSTLTLVAGDPWGDPPPADGRIATFDAIAGTQFRIAVEGIMCDDGPPVCWHPAQGTFVLTWVPSP